jgi:hypothetical protein
VENKGSDIMSYSKYKEYAQLYNEVEEELQGYYNKKNFIVAIVEQNYNYIMGTVKSLELYCDNEKLVEKLISVVYEF